MQSALRKVVDSPAAPIVVTHTPVGAPRRLEAEAYIRAIFASRYQAEPASFAPNLVMMEQRQRIIAATGWRGAGAETLYLERYLDTPIETAMEKLASEQVVRERIVEVGHLAADKPGASVHVILTLADYLHRIGFEWVVFTATQELIRIFTRLGLPLLALAKADPARLGSEAGTWGRYYDTEPVVV
ncbi:MAG: thermostable hemolysin, partial [Polaromonas sp.]|uniref:thermostable hemolysin n=1 Tax=Polaromonas sp. TaxID=1869339 RepID=UPI004036FB14